MRILTRTLLAAAGSLIATTAVLAAPARPASALPACAYPYVCLYRLGSDGFPYKTGQFRQFTAGWQYLTTSRSALFYQNTRHDDVVYVRYANGVVGCLPPNGGGSLSGAPSAIRIDPSPVCRF